MANSTAAVARRASDLGVLFRMDTSILLGAGAIGHWEPSHARRGHQGSKNQAVAAGSAELRAESRLGRVALRAAVVLVWQEDSGERKFLFRYAAPGDGMESIECDTVKCKLPTKTQPARGPDF